MAYTRPTKIKHRPHVPYEIMDMKRQYLRYTWAELLRVIGVSYGSNEYWKRRGRVPKMYFDRMNEIQQNKSILFKRKTMHRVTHTKGDQV